MPEQLPDADLTRARRNVERIADFLLERRTLAVEDGGDAQLQRLWSGVLAVSERLQPVLRAAGASPPRPAALPEAPAAAAGRLETARVQRFAEFVEQLDGWLGGHGKAVESDDGVAAAAGLYAALTTIRGSVSEMLDRAQPAAPAAPASSPEQPPADAASAASGTPETPAVPRPAESPPPVPVRSTRRLLLADLDERPLLQEFQGSNELTSAAQQLLTEFLEEHGISLGGYQRHKLDDAVQRWIEATPDGQVLVLKIGGLRGRLEPYPSYVPREGVLDEINQLRGYAGN